MQERDRKTVTLVLGVVRRGKCRRAQAHAAGAKRVAFFSIAELLEREMRAEIRGYREVGRIDPSRPVDFMALEELAKPFHP